MGDTADFLTDDMLEAKALHDRGECSGPCQWCDEEPPPLCPYCGSAPRLVDSAEIYGVSYGMAWVCDHWPACDSYCGCHRGTTRALGTLANAELRAARKAAHAAFDPLWQRDSRCRCFNRRLAAYMWLAANLGLPVTEAHIARFNVEQCRRVVELVKEKLP